MANDVKWIKMMVGMFDGMSFKKIKRAKIGGESFRDKLTAVWFELMDFAGKCNHEGAFISPAEIPFTDLADIATMIDRETEELQLCMTFFINEGMVTVVDDVYSLSNWSEYQNKEGLDKIRAQTRERVARHREAKRLLCSGVNVTGGNVTDSVTVTECNALDKDKDLESEGEDNNSASQPSPAAVDAFFDAVWNLYPVKKGKGQVSKSKRLALYKIGLDELTRAINRYTADLQKDTWRKPQNGSTFFNSGYVDYLDANYTPDERMNANGGNTGNTGQAQRIGHYI